jgi:IMP dehydrogenase/GMP reductase
MDENEKRNGWMKMIREGGIGIMFRSYILHRMGGGVNVSKKRVTSFFFGRMVK